MQWVSQRRGAAGKLIFTVKEDSRVKITEGTAVKFGAEGRGLFYGFVFSQRRDREGLIQVTAYDQIRYLKNKDTYVYENKTASELLKMIADDFGLKTGEIEDTGYVIASRIEENVTLLDMIENALDLTYENSGKMFVLYDQAGRLTLKSRDNMYVRSGAGYMIVNETAAENLEYLSSIDIDTKNRIKLAYDSGTSGKRELYIAEDKKNIGSWGVLQHYGTVKEGENGQAKAEELLKLYNAKTRRLKIKGAFGGSETVVRGGSLIAVSLDLGDSSANGFMTVERVTHTFKSEGHFMDIELRGL